MNPAGQSSDSDTVLLRPVGAGRYFEALFLGVWLAFWSIFEVVVTAVLGSMLLALFVFFGEGRLSGVGRAALNRATGFEVGFAVVFLGLFVWLALWTVAGVAAGSATGFASSSGLRQATGPGAFSGSSRSDATRRPSSARSAELPVRAAAAS